MTDEKKIPPPLADDIVERGPAVPMTDDEFAAIEHGHVGCRCDRLLQEVRRLQGELARAREEEREDCAGVAYQHSAWGEEIAALIRARGEKT